MKKIKFLLRSVIMMAVISLGSTFFTGLSHVAASSRAQCGVNYTQAVNYLQTCSHHHTVNFIEPIPGTNNYRASVDGGSTAVVNVANGIITHEDPGSYTQ